MKIKIRLGGKLQGAGGTKVHHADGNTLIEGGSGGSGSDLEGRVEALEDLLDGYADASLVTCSGTITVLKK